MLEQCHVHRVIGYATSTIHRRQRPYCAAGMRNSRAQQYHCMHLRLPGVFSVVEAVSAAARAMAPWQGPPKAGSRCWQHQHSSVLTVFVAHHTHRHGSQQDLMEFQHSDCSTWEGALSLPIQGRYHGIPRRHGCETRRWHR